MEGKDSKLIIGELLGYARSIGFAHRHAKIFDYLYWKWQQKQLLSDADDSEMVTTDQAIEAFDTCLEAVLEELEPKIRVSFLELIEILNQQGKPH